MNNARFFFLAICSIAYILPAFGQKDTLTADGLFLKYNSPRYHMSGLASPEAKKILNMPSDANFSFPIYNDSDRMIRGEFAKNTKRAGLSYKVPPQYTMSEEFGLESPPNPIELLQNVGNLITSQWVHEDGECILFMKCAGTKPNKNFTGLPDYIYRTAKQIMGMGSSFSNLTTKEIEKMKKRMTFWPSEKAKEAFNAQHVVIYPVKNKKAIYMEKYTHKLELEMIKWHNHLTVSFLVTKKGARNIDKYIKDVEEAFEFED